MLLTIAKRLIVFVQTAKAVLYDCPGVGLMKRLHVERQCPKAGNDGVLKCLSVTVVGVEVQHG